VVVSLATGFVYAPPRGKLWAIRNFYCNAWPRAQQRAAVAFNLYDLRHTFSSRRLAAGIPLIEVSAWMGHGLRAGGHEITNPTTRVYVHATGERRQAALDELATLSRGHRSWPQAACDMSLSDPHKRIPSMASWIEAGISRVCGSCGAQRPAADRKKVTGR
jgi:hypothetical protein